ncbi:hypothetical protein GXM_04877 [Nostoc sphaeroides CCNUC1]|uniref:Uncharacterized protein n=1 Tax=Nostoc sphaeroides CCNUC1 TaxID=2653204 RepID=A0A5P8W3Q6_9NOSO|nr:hypothetical protein GXM_04877 [Nostoc sphaeroides CCNUC1]
MLWGGQHERPVHSTGETPILQEILGYFITWKSLKSPAPNADEPCGLSQKHLRNSFAVSISLYPLQAFASTQFSRHKLFLAKAVDKGQEIG